MKKIVLFFLLVCFVFSLSACSNSTDGKYKYFLTLSHAEINMEQGDSFALRASYSDNETAITFYSDNESVATVAEDGTIWAVSIGECFIVAKAGDVEKSCKIYVSAPVYNIELAYIDVENVQVGAKVNITALLYKDGVLIDGEFDWSVNPSANCSLKVVNNKAVFEALQQGEYIVVVSNSKCSAQCSFNVVNATLN